MSTGVAERVNVVMKLFTNGLPKFTQLRIYVHYSTSQRTFNPHFVSPVLRSFLIYRRTAFTYFFAFLRRCPESSATRPRGSLDHLPVSICSHQNPRHLEPLMALVTQPNTPVLTEQSLVEAAKYLWLLETKYGGQT